jgi:predicted glycogen debranching enzyme
MSFNYNDWFLKQYPNFSLPIESIEISSIQADDKREWLITNGLGSFASGSISSANTRRYHGLLIAALNIPVKRYLFFSKIDEYVNGINLSTNIWQNNIVEPQGFKSLFFFTAFPIPTWVFTINTGYLIKQIVMPKNKQQVSIAYSYVSNIANHNKKDDSIALDLHLLVNDRDFHSQSKAFDFKVEQMVSNNSILAQFTPSNHKLFFSFVDASYIIDPNWYNNYYWPREYERGLVSVEDAFHMGVLKTKLNSGSTFTLSVSTDNSTYAPINKVINEQIIHWNNLSSEGNTPFKKSLLLAADSFIVERQTYHSVIAGYHWFNDWGRDTMISLPGLAIATKRFALAKSIIQTFAHYLSEGMLPNNFPDHSNEPSYNNADAVFWWAIAIYQYYKATKDLALIKEVLPLLNSVYEWHLSSTRYGIHIDSQDYLLTTANTSVQLTWMDAKVGDFVVTPRTGKVVELNALWLNFLHILKEFNSIDIGERIDKTAHSFNKTFWNKNKACLYDVINIDKSIDASIRPNQLFAISLPFSLLNQEKSLSVLSVVEKELLTVYGLRSLSCLDSNYHGQYGNGLPSANQYERDITYHQGTVWSWLIGPWVDARYKIYGMTKENHLFIAKSLKCLKDHMVHAAGIGFISEIFDGNYPHIAHGCIAQAWSTAEYLRILCQYPELENYL